MIQSLYDTLFPGNSTTDTSFDGYQVATSDIHIEVENVKYNPLKQMKFWQEKKGLIPVLRTGMPEKRQNSLIESTLALKKRNLAAPKLQDSVNEFFIIEEVIKKAETVFFDPMLIDNSNMNSNETMMRWWDKQTPKTQDTLIKKVRDISEIDVCTYNFMIKNDVKPKMDVSVQSEYAPLQTVIYPEKDVNALFGPVMKEINERIRMALRPHVVYNTRMSADELDDSVEFLDVNEDFESFEIDFSKFDKSKTSLHIKAVIELYKLFGLEDMLAFLWEKSQCQTFVKDKLNGLCLHILYQQKSGNCDTYGSNTWSAALALLHCMPLEKATYMTFGGDDSLILFPKGTVVADPCTKLAMLWNFDCKLFNFKHNMFCGKFLLKIGSVYKFAPDPIKLITKLGRKDIKDEEVLREIFISCKDNFKSYCDERVLRALNVATQERYRSSCDGLAAFYALQKMLSDYTLFAGLFNCKVSWYSTLFSDSFKLLNRFFEW